MITQIHTRSAVSIVLIGGLIAGTLDILSAFLLSRVSPEQVLIFISSGLFGREKAVAGGGFMIALGLVFHYIIAFSWTIIYFFVFPKAYSLISNRPVLAILFGLAIWSVMNLIVLPLSAIPHIPLSLAGFLRGASVLIVAIAVPLTWIYKAYYFPKSR